MFSSPIKQKKVKVEKEEVLKLPKKEKCKIPSSTVKKLLLIDGEASEQVCLWVERWLDHLRLEQSLPPQFVSKDAHSQICQFLAPIDALKTLEKIRKDYERDFPTMNSSEDSEKEQKDSFQFLDDVPYHEIQKSVQDH